jgi:type II restriction enzyme
MAKKAQLRTLHAGVVLNKNSAPQEAEVLEALDRVCRQLKTKFGDRIWLYHERQWKLKDIVAELRSTYPQVELHHHFDDTSIRPDGGILYLRSIPGDPLTYPILIVEVKNQGTNDQRVAEGKPRQARGNAIERLGKNLIGLRTALMRESIFPFVCFGYGCDFEPDSSILDRVTTMAMFGKLNKTYLHNEGEGRFNRGSFYFQPDKWSVDKMVDVMQDIAERSVQYYFSKYGEAHFKVAPPT